VRGAGSPDEWVAAPRWSRRLAVLGGVAAGSRWGGRVGRGGGGGKTHAGGGALCEGRVCGGGAEGGGGRGEGGGAPAGGGGGGEGEGVEGVEGLFDEGCGGGGQAPGDGQLVQGHAGVVGEGHVDGVAQRVPCEAGPAVGVDGGERVELAGVADEEGVLEEFAG